jgi:polyhydroxyalkanoate synthesis regulator phasin
VKKLLDLLISLSWGTFSLTREKAEKIGEKLLEKGKTKIRERRKIVRTLVERGNKEKAEFGEFINSKILKLFQKGSLVPRSEFIDLEKRVKTLEELTIKTNQEIP